MAEYKRDKISDTTKFVEFIRENCVREDTLFRGQPVDEPLLPKLARDTTTPRPNVLVAEKRMIRDFKRRSLPLLDIKPTSNWDWLAIAQHHGMATRLLDWTLNPLVALWFAVNRPPQKKNGMSRDAVVWMLAPSLADFASASTKTDPFTIGRTRIYRPKHMASRLVSQAGWFTVHMFKKKDKRFIPLEKNRAYAAKLTKLRIPSESFSRMRHDLDRFNVNRSSLFPDVDGLCSHIQWLHTSLEDEVDFEV